jgi:type I restriction enzyme R subunit
MIEFKQIVGRGTRLFDGKDYFTIYDFVKAHEHFQDPEWDGEPLPPDPCEKCGDIPCSCVKPPPKACSKCGEIPCVCLPEPCSECGELPCCCSGKKMIKVKLAEGKELEIQHMMATSFWSTSGTPISQEEFLIQLFGDLPELFKNEGELREIWCKPGTRRKLLEGLEEKGYGSGQLMNLAKMIDAEKSDLYDVLSYVAFSVKPITRETRVAMHEDRLNSLYFDKQQEFIQFVLAQYVKEGVSVLDDQQLPTLIDIKYHTIRDAAKEIGTPDNIRELFVGFQKHLYEPVPA